MIIGLGNQDQTFEVKSVPDCGFECEVYTDTPKVSHNKLMIQKIQVPNYKALPLSEVRYCNMTVPVITPVMIVCQSLWALPREWPLP